MGELKPLLHCAMAVKEVKRDGVFTRFMDMYSGGECKLDAEYIYIEETEDSAVDIFKAVFDRDPHNVTCLCCGEDYSYGEVTDPEIESGSFVMAREDIDNWMDGNR